MNNSQPKKRKILGTFWLLTLALFLVPLFNIGLTDCAMNTCSEVQWGYSNGEFDHYGVNANLKTPSGISYDPTDQPISPELIDRLTNEVEYCLENTFNSTTLPNDVVQSSRCEGSTIHVPIDRSNIVVKIPNDWVFNCDNTQEVLPTPVMAGPYGCMLKGQTPTPQCPCRWRAGIKCPNILITTPSFYIYKDVLIRFITGCQDPWGSQELSKCATPSTTPLGDGTDPNNGL